ncbi:MAG: hypothetical protein GX957_15935, partial [Clostridiaceae bacterium]|nr:hypothetical protein [Clostridiaceae bacterium]
IYGQNITLGGNFGGDVYIHDISENSSLNILPGTNISGKLTYEGKDTYQLPSNVNVSDYEFIKVQPSAAAQPTVGRTVLSYVKKIITLIVYYLFALLIYKLFPRYFEKSGLFIARRPGTATAIGIAAFGSMAGGVIFLFILLLITLFIFKGSVFLFVGLVFFFIIIITVLFAEIPVSLWLGGMVLKDRNSVPGRLALGLVIIWIIKFVLGMLKGLPGAGVAGIILFILNACIWILGTGAILKTVFEIIKGANTHAEVDLDAIEGIDHAGW